MMGSGFIPPKNTSPRKQPVNTRMPSNATFGGKNHQQDSSVSSRGKSGDTGAFRLPMMRSKSDRREMDQESSQNNVSAVFKEPRAPRTLNSDKSASLKSANVTGSGIAAIKSSQTSQHTQGQMPL